MCESDNRVFSNEFLRKIQAILPLFERTKNQTSAKHYDTAYITLTLPAAAMCGSEAEEAE